MFLNNMITLSDVPKYHRSSKALSVIFVPVLGDPRRNGSRPTVAPALAVPRDQYGYSFSSSSQTPARQRFKYIRAVAPPSAVPRHLGSCSSCSWTYSGPLPQPFLDTMFLFQLFSDIRTAAASPAVPRYHCSCSASPSGSCFGCS